MRVVPEDFTASSFESAPSVRETKPEVVAKVPTRGVLSSLSFSSLERKGSKRNMMMTMGPPSSPRSTAANLEDGVILTNKTRIGKITRRHSMSRTFGPPARTNSISTNDANQRISPSSAHSPETSSTKGLEPKTFDEVVRMRPGLKRRESLRRVLQQSRAISEENLGYKYQPAVAAAAPRPSRRPIMRRASLGDCGRMASSPVLGRQQQRRNSGGGRTSVFHRTPSYRKTDSLRDWQAIGNNSSNRDSQRSLASTGSQPSGSNGTRRGLQRQSSLAELMVDCNTTVSVSNTWASVRRIENYQQRLGEQIILKFIELDPLAARMNLRLESFFSDRFNELCQVLCETIDMIVTLLGPELDEAGAELAQCGETCRAQGIVTDRLGEAVSTAIDKLLGPEEITPDMVKAWRIVFDALRRRLQAST